MNIYSTLTNFEILELTYLIRSDIYFNLSIFMTALFGYIAVAHIAAKSLSRFQLWSISSIYTLLITVELVAMSSAVRAMGELLEAQGSSPLPIYQYALVGLFLVAWVISIVYMSEARKRDNSKSDM